MTGSVVADDGAGGRSIVDLDAHGVVGVRLVDAPAALIRHLRDGLGDPPTLDRSEDPDITIRFGQPRVPDEAITLGTRGLMFSQGVCYIGDRLRGRTVASFRFEDVGRRLDVRCDPQVREVPFFAEFLNYAFLAAGHVPLHASAVIDRGQGLVFAGWPRGGKTGALLGFLARGATYVGDEWLMLSPDGRLLAGFGWPMSVAEWQLRQIGQAPQAPRLTNRVVAALRALYRRIDGTAIDQRRAAHLLGRVLDVVPSSAKVAVRPERLAASVEPSARPTHLFLLIDRPRGGIEVAPCAVEDFAVRMTEAAIHEQREFQEAYRAHLFADPRRRNPLIDTAPTRLDDMLRGALGSATTFEVHHPYGGSLQELCAALAHVAGAAASPMPPGLPGR